MLSVAKTLPVLRRDSEHANKLAQELKKIQVKINII
jgi:hypothetical protein